ncbi:MAG: hypothetical protein ACRD8O_19790, partial [Bryobacteraceae bacterium]
LLCTLLLATACAMAASNYVDSLKPGKPALKSAGALAFGPDGILFVGDSVSATIFALDTGDRSAAKSGGTYNLTAINQKIAALIGSAPDQVMVNDVVVNPISKKAYISVSRGRGPDALPVLVRTDAAGKLEEVPLTNVKHSAVLLPNAPDPSAKTARGAVPRLEAITDLAYVDGKVIVAGLSNEEFSSNLRTIPFPFREADKGASVEIFHGQHGRLETNSPVRTFVPYEIKNETFILAAYTCTPLVKFPVAQLKPGVKIMGTTIAELGNRNRPIDMVVYKKDGKNFILMANNSRGVMKLPADNLETYEGITKQVEKQGVPYETLAELKNVDQLDRLDDSSALILTRSEAGSLDLKSIPLP